MQDETNAADLYARNRIRRQVVPGDVLDLEVEIIAQRGPVGVGKAIASVEGKRAVTCEIKFAVEQ